MKTERLEVKESVADLLQATRKEIEQFREELGNEKIQVSKKYEELVEELKNSLTEMKELVQYNQGVVKSTASDLQVKLAALEKQVNTSRGNTAKDLQAHLEILKNTLDGITHNLGQQSSYNEIVNHLYDRLQRFRIKFQLLLLKMQLGTLKMKVVVTGAKQEASQRIENLRNLMENAEDGIKKNWKKFRNEINEAYTLIHDAFTK